MGPAVVTVNLHLTPSAALTGIEHLELRLGETAVRETRTPVSPVESGLVSPATAAPHVEREILVDEISAVRVKTVDVLLDGADVPPAVRAGVARLVERLPALQGLTLTCAAMPGPNATALAMDLYRTCNAREIAFAVDFILDAEADALAALGAHTAVASPDGLASVLRAARALRGEGLPVRWLLPLARGLVYRLEPLFSLARDERIEPVLTLHRIAHDVHDRASAMLDDDERLFVRDFITYRLLDEERQLHSAPRRDWYRALNDALADSSNLEAARTYRVAVLTADDAGSPSTWQWHAESRPSLDGAAAELRTPTVGGSRNAGAGRLVAQAIDAGTVLTEGGLALVQRMRGWIVERMRPLRPRADPERFETALLIGAYGGDHIGDTAILGGVLFRIHRRYGTTRAVLLSQRPAHTRHLVAMLDTPVPVEVDAYELATIRARLREVDAVVFAGGPLIDLPKQLVKHFYTVAMARRSGKPFIMEGIGPGPFPRWPSEWTARRLVRVAQRISVRTSADAGSALMRGLAPEIGRDPAFDYLATRGTRLTRLRAQDREWIERLLQDTRGRLLVAMNLRPIRHLFTVGGPARKRAEYTRLMETQCEQELAAGMHRFHLVCAVPPCFVFFPMNAIQFGMSDLRSAYRVKRLLHADVDFRTWQADAGLDGVVALLRRVNIVITMRFHATIFALAQQRRVIGIDYRVGQRDKVGDLLADFEQSENCRRIDEIEADWLCGRLSALAAAGESASGQRTLLKASPAPNQ